MSTFITPTKTKLIVAAAVAVAATAGGLLWYNYSFAATQMTQISDAITTFESTSSLGADLSINKETLINQLGALLNRECQFKDFLVSSIQLYDQKIASLASQAYRDHDLLFFHQDIISAILSVLSSGIAKFPKLIAKLPKIFLDTQYLDSNRDFLDFFLTTMPYIKESDAINFINSHIINDEILRHEFLSKLIYHSYNLRHYIKQSGLIVEDEVLSNSSFFFSCFFPLINDEAFLSTLDPACFLQGLVSYNNKLNYYNNDIWIFSSRENFLVEWQRLLLSVISSPSFIKNASEIGDGTILHDIFRQIINQLYFFQLRFGILQSEIGNANEIYLKRLLPYCSIMVLVEEALKSLDVFLKNITKAGLNVQTYKAAFMKIILDFMMEIEKYSSQTYAIFYHEIVKTAITLMIIHCTSSTTCIPSSKTIASFWDTTSLPKNSNNLMRMRYLQTSITPLFDNLGIVSLVEQQEQFYKADAKQHVKNFIAILNNKKSHFNRLRVIEYQFAILQSEFEDAEVQKQIELTVFKVSDSDTENTNAIMGNLLNIAEKLFTPLHLLNYTHECKSSLPGEAAIISKYIRRCTINGLHYLKILYETNGQTLSKEKALSHLQNEVYPGIQFEQLDDHIENNTDSDIVLKESADGNVLELFFDREMVIKAFMRAKLPTLKEDQKVLYESLATVNEVQYRLFTKTSFQNYLIRSVFSNSEIVLQMLPYLVVLYELIIDFIYKTQVVEGDTNPSLIVLRNQFCQDTKVIDSLNAARDIFNASIPEARGFNEQMFSRIHARLRQIRGFEQ